MNEETFAEKNDANQNFFMSMASKKDETEPLESHHKLRSFELNDTPRINDNNNILGGFNKENEI
jgi:hypothetical protein